MLRGYDVVAYVTQSQALPGSTQFRTDFEGVTYLFGSAEHLALFLRDPAKYQPAYHGYDATRMVYAMPEQADPTVWRLRRRAPLPICRRRLEGRLRARPGTATSPWPTGTGSPKSPAATAPGRACGGASTACRTTAAATSWPRAVAAAQAKPG